MASEALTMAVFPGMSKCTKERGQRMSKSEACQQVSGAMRQRASRGIEKGLPEKQEESLNAVSQSTRPGPF